MGSTKVELITDLEKELARQNLTSVQREEVEAIIDRAKKGYYHDFESQIATPKMQLVTDLMFIGFTTIAKRVKNGAYDDELPRGENYE